MRADQHRLLAARRRPAATRRPALPWPSRSTSRRAPRTARGTRRWPRAPRTGTAAGGSRRSRRSGPRAPGRATSARRSRAQSIDCTVRGRRSAQASGLGSEIRTAWACRWAGQVRRMRSMEFQDVVRRRRMVRSYADAAGGPGRRRPAARPTPCARRARGSARAGRSWCSTGPTTSAVLGEHQPAGRRTAGPAGSPGCARRRWSSCRCRTRRPTSTATPSRTRAGRTGTRRRWPVPYWHIDTGMAALLILQTAVDEGLGACFFGIPRRAARGVPRGVRGAGGLHADRRGHRRPPHRPPRSAGLAVTATAPTDRRGRAPRALVTTLL